MTTNADKIAGLRYHQVLYEKRAMRALSPVDKARLEGMAAELGQRADKLLSDKG
jgi:hypothetical protein